MMANDEVVERMEAQLRRRDAKIVSLKKENETLRQNIVLMRKKLCSGVTAKPKRGRKGTAKMVVGVECSHIKDVICMTIDFISRSCWPNHKVLPDG